ncbi:MAG: hypothetical protein AMJ76_02570, partial [Dehalococcoidia bacterium SM23_28_1]
MEWLGDHGPDWLPYIVSAVIGSITLLVFLLVSLLMVAWAERRLLGRVQARLGPNRVGPWGVFQSIADAIKMLTKEAITSASVDRWVFWLAPMLVAVPALVLFAVLPFNEGMVLADLNVGVLFLVAIGSVTAIPIFMAGWS